MPKNERVMLAEEGLASVIISILALTVNFSNLFFITKDDREKGEENKFY